MRLAMRRRITASQMHLTECARRPPSPPVCAVFRKTKRAGSCTGLSAQFGTATAQGQMFDAATIAGAANGGSNGTSQPRYNHPLEPVPGATFLTVAPCTTNLLFPWVLNFASAFFATSSSSLCPPPCSRFSTIFLKPLTTMLSGVLGFAERLPPIGEIEAIVVGFGDPELCRAITMRQLQ